MKQRTADQAKEEIMSSETFLRIEKLYARKEPSADAKARSERIKLILELVAKLRREIGALKDHLLPGEWDQLRQFMVRSKKYALVMWCLAEENLITVPDRQSL